MTREQVGGDAVRAAVGKRTGVLAALADRPRRKPALVEALDVSRSTVDRAVDELTAAGLVRERDGAFEATTAGELALDAHDQYTRLTDGIGAARPLLDALPPDAAFDKTLLDGGEVRLADPHAPEGALASVVESLDDVDVLRGFAPVVKSNYVGLLHDHVVDGDLSVEIILEDAARESLTTVAAARPGVETFLAAESVTVLETTATLPFALWLLGETGPEATPRSAGLTVHDAGGIVGVLTAAGDSSLAWCRDRYERERAAATELSPTDLLE